MAKRLSENLNSLYLGAAQRLRSKSARCKIIAYVESYDDIFFWRTLLSEFEDDEFYFEVMLPSQRSLAKGKKVVLMNNLGERLGRNMIACVDADYDYLMQDTTYLSRFINRSPYVFHTYVYAIENYQCYAESLHDVCVMATLNDRKIIDFPEFLRVYSTIIFPLFVWSVWAYRYDRYNTFSLMDFANIVSIEKINIQNLSDTLERLQHKVNRKINWLQHKFPQGRKTYAPMRQQIMDLGVTPENTYLYMQGHTLFNSVVMPLLDPVCKQLRRQREREIKELACHNTQMDNELSSYQHSQDSVEMMLRKHIYYKNAPQYQFLREDMRRFIEHLRTEIGGKNARLQQPAS